MSFLSVSPKDLHVRDLHQHLLGAINPRPVAFVATRNEDGTSNLAPFSFFNVFGANPPIIIFSPARRGRDNTTKHTYENIKRSGECTVNIVDYSMTYQMVLASAEYPEGVDEFTKAGFNKLPSSKVAALRVAESPAQFECVVKEILNYGELAGGGNMIVAEIVQLHINEAVLGDDGKIDQYKIDTIGRCGKAYYTRTRDSLFSIKNPVGNSNIGFDGLPDEVKNSKILTGNDLARLAVLHEVPAQSKANDYLKQNSQFQNLSADAKHIKAQEFIQNDRVEEAWYILLS